MKRFTILLGLAILFLAPVVLADVPKLINFQGILRDGSGNPVPDAVYVIRFRIYDDSTAGANLWEEFDDVQTTGGLFNVRLGDTTNLPNGLFEGSVNRFVGVKVGGDPETAPRTRLISVPFAFHALRSDSTATATVALDLTCTGCVGAGDIDGTQVQRRVTGTAPVGEYITAINQDGSVATASDQVGTASGWTDNGTTVRLTTGTDSVGIGTATPNAPLHVNSVSALEVGRFQSSSAQPYLSLWYGTFEGARMQTVNDVSDGGSLRFFTAAPPLGSVFERMRITSAGNVGLGTASPTKKLEVAGSIKADTVFSNNLSSNSPLNVQAPAGATRMYVDDVTGHVGIGIGAATPEARLHVRGGSPPRGIIIENTAGTNSDDIRIKRAGVESPRPIPVFPFRSDLTTPTCGSMVTMEQHLKTLSGSIMLPMPSPSRPTGIISMSTMQAARSASA